jgi:histidyl-tRNA synthetase
VTDAAPKKEQRRKFQAIRGTRDLLPPDTTLWNHVEETAHAVLNTFGFGEIRPPIFEPTDLFARAVGGDTDIVSKEMYSFKEGGFGDSQDMQESMDFVNALNSPALMESYIKGLEADLENGGLPKSSENENAISTMRNVSRDLFAIPKPSEEGPEEAALERFFEYQTQRKPFETRLLNAWLVLRGKEMMSLRPEATASVCRAYIEHNMQQLPQPQKLYYIGPMFRRERPQKGRYRQFYQIGAEVLENVKPDPTRDAAKELAKDAITDAEVIQMVMTFFDKLKLFGVQLEINSIGHAADNCRRGYVALLKSELEKVKDKLGADSQRRIETNPLRVLDSKLEHEQPIIATLPQIADHLCDDCKTHYAAVKRELELRGVFYKENWRLVRGLDYYMRTTFEITAQGLGSQNAVCGGGRYDGLVELLGGPPTKGIGFAIGEDRLILSLQEAKDAALAAGKRPPFVYVAWMGANAYAAAVHAAKNLRAAGIRVELPPVEQKFGKALERASKLGAHYALILGDNEVAEGTWTLKTLADGTQQKFTEPHLLDFLKKL